MPKLELAYKSLSHFESQTTHDRCPLVSIEHSFRQPSLLTIPTIDKHPTVSRPTRVVIVSATNMDISHEQLVERWPAKLAQENFGQDVANRAAICALQQLAASSITPVEAAKQYADAYHDDLASKKITQPWGVLCEAIRELGNGPEHAQLFVDVIKSLAELFNVHGNAYVFWRDLPYLACNLSDFCFGKLLIH